jgi:hypothetical protein
MRKVVLALMVVIGAASTLVIASLAVADSGTNSLDARQGLMGFQEVPAISTTGNGTFEAKVASDGMSFDWTLSYADLEGGSPPLQAHIHFGQFSVNGGISIFLCSNLGNGPAGTAACPAQPATISGNADATDVVGPAGQGIEAGSFAEILAAIRAGKAYANVHTTRWPGGEIRGQLNNGGDDD